MTTDDRPEWGDYLARLAAMPACPGCGRPAGPDPCEACAERSIDAARILEHLGDVVERMLTAAGLCRRELGATVSEIPAPLGEALRRRVNPHVQALLSGQTPRAGFGLSGSAGCGKTCALVALFRQAHTSRIRATVAAQGPAAAARWLTWIPWPDRVHAMRARSTQDGGLDAVMRAATRWARSEALVVDDLGAERVRDTADDWASSVLDFIVDRRHRDGLPTWYTTNLEWSEFVLRYGQRLSSRLCGPNPLVELPALRDLRRAKGKGEPLG